MYLLAALGVLMLQTVAVWQGKGSGLLRASRMTYLIGYGIWMNTLEFKWSLGCCWSGSGVALV
jgi:hypothetical protein